MLRITDITYTNLSLSGSGTLNTLSANIGDQVQINISFEHESVNVATASNIISFAPVSINSLNTGNQVYTKNVQFTNDLKVGDTLVFTGFSFGSRTSTVTKIIDSYTFEVSGSAFTTSTQTSGNIINSTVLKGLRYNYNFVENGSDFESLTDGDLLEFTFDDCDATDGTDKTMLQNNSNSIGVAVVTGYGSVVNGRYGFQIRHSTTVTPLFLQNQYDNLKNNVKPNYFEGSNSLNYICKITMSRELGDTTNTLQATYLSKSNIGWYNENFKGGKSNYYISSLTYTNLATTNVIDSLEINSETQVDIVLKSNNSTFIEDSTYVKLGFTYLPESETFYQNNSNTYAENFRYDYKKVLDDDIEVNGAYFGTTNQIIKTIKATYIDADTINIKAVIELGSDAKAKIQEGDYDRYLLTVTTEDFSLDDKNKDRVNLICDVNSFIEELQDIDLIQIDTLFIEHPYESGDFGTNTLTIQPVDDVVCNSVMTIDLTGKENDNIKIVSVKPSLVLKHPTQSQIELESYTINTQNYANITYGNFSVQDINFAQGRAFKIPNEIRRNIVFARDYNNDNIGSNIFRFALNYPFMMSWEYWKQLIISNMTADFFDISANFKGYNQNWSRLAGIGDWYLSYRIDTTIERKGQLYNQTFYKNISSIDFNDNTDWSNSSIESFDKTTDAPLENSGNWFIKGYEDTKIVAHFEYVGLTVPENVAIVLWIETFEKGGKFDIRRCSSVWDNDSQSWFKDNKVTVTDLGGGVFEGMAYIDSSKLPTDTKYTVYARIYEIINEEDLFRITNDDIIRETMNGLTRLIL